MNWYLKAFKNYFNFSGRAQRTEFWWFFLFNNLICFGISFVANLLGDQFVTPLIYILIALLPSLALSVRRNHDAGYSGWWIFCPVFNFVLLFLKSVPEDNRWGPYTGDPQA
jgi:uncharacterized membrane protein YhaH (DUF805 family)